MYKSYGRSADSEVPEDAPARTLPARTYNYDGRPSAN